MSADAGGISADEAAKRLGIKRETLYAYVSRGQLGSVRAAARDGSRRASRFDAAEVAALAARRVRGRAGRSEIAIASSVTEIREQRVRYRGHELAALVAQELPFESVAQLLWSGALASTPAWTPDPRALRLARPALRALPEDAPLLERLRIATACASAADPLRHDLRREAVAALGARLIALWAESTSRAGVPHDGSIASRLWLRLTEARATPAGIAALNAALVVLADHDLAASTYAVRIAASVRADPYSALGAGLGALGGALHGLASRGARSVLAAAIDRGAAVALGETLASASSLAGFGHPLYPDGDPRATLLVARVLELGPAKRVVRAIVELRELVRERTGQHPNVDFALAALAEAAGMAPHAGEAIFAIARCAGWLAHALDEYAEPAVAFRYRPVARYVGAQAAQPPQPAKRASAIPRTPRP